MCTLPYSGEHDGNDLLDRGSPRPPGRHRRGVSATREPVAITDHGQTIAILVSPADALELQELQELRALAAYRARQARGESTGVPHVEAYRRVFGDEA
ncbi:type II toxin-antitoxin system prevent-host-death family antitoxin [Streptomyces sp. NPDC055036]